MELWDCHFMAFYPGWTSKGYSMEFHGNLESPNKKSPSSMGFHGIRRAPLQMTQVFHGIPWNIPWNSMELWCRQMTYHLVPWNSMEHSMEFHGTLVSPNEVSLNPWNSMELWDCHFMAFYPGWTSKGYSMEFHGNLESPNKKSPSSMGFHGIRRAPLQMTQVFHGIPWNIPWNSMERWCRQMKYQLVPWNSMEYSMEFHWTLVPPNDISLSSMEFHGSFHGIPWNFAAAKWSIT